MMKKTTAEKENNKFSQAKIFFIRNFNFYLSIDYGIMQRGEKQELLIEANKSFFSGRFVLYSFST